MKTVNIPGAPWFPLHSLPWGNVMEKDLPLAATWPLQWGMMMMAPWLTFWTAWMPSLSPFIPDSAQRETHQQHEAAQQEVAHEREKAT